MEEDRIYCGGATSMGELGSSKVIVFSWQALLGRLPTRDNLVHRQTVTDLEIVISGVKVNYYKYI
jgi:hypothetical protein